MLRVRDKRVHARLKDKRTLCTGGGSGVQVLRWAGLLRSLRRAPRMEGKVTSDEVLKQNGELPRDARVMAQLLKSMGVEEYQPRVLNQLLEFMYRYVSEILQDGLMYAEHAGRQELSVDDVQLAVQARVNSSFTQPPPRELLLELAKEKNSNPLPPYPARLGVLLPPEEHCLIQPTYQIEPKPAPKRTSQPHSHTGRLTDPMKLPCPSLRLSGGRSRSRRMALPSLQALARCQVRRLPGLPLFLIATQRAHLELRR